MSNGNEVRGAVERAVEEYNKYRSPESTALLLSIEGRRFTIAFVGPYCRTCGFYDYFDDYRVFLEELGVRSKIINIVEVEEGAVVEFEVEDGGEEGVDRKD